MAARGALGRRPGLRAQLEQRGGHCDCEIIFNVVPADPAEPDGRPPG
jgi:hypothetical protein